MGSGTVFHSGDLWREQKVPALRDSHSSWGDRNKQAKNKRGEAAEQEDHPFHVHTKAATTYSATHFENDLMISKNLFHC